MTLWSDPHLQLSFQSTAQEYTKQPCKLESDLVCLAGGRLIRSSKAIFELSSKLLSQDAHD